MDRHVVQVQPAGLELEVEPGEAVMAAALRAGYQWPTVCGGVAACRVCCVRVLSGEENLVPAEAREREALDELRQAGRDVDGMRLACQLRLRGDAVVEKRGVRAVSAGDNAAPARR